MARSTYKLAYFDIEGRAEPMYVFLETDLSWRVRDGQAFQTASGQYEF